MKLRGNMLKDARDRKGLTQAELAQQLGLNVVTVTKAETGGDIFVTTGRLICKFLDVDLEKAVIPRVSESEDPNAA